MRRRPGVEGEHVSSYPPNLAPYLTRTLTVCIDKSDFYICLLMRSAAQFSTAEPLVSVVKACFNYLFNLFFFFCILRIAGLCLECLLLVNCEHLSPHPYPIPLIGSHDRPSQSQWGRRAETPQQQAAARPANGSSCLF